MPPDNCCYESRALIDCNFGAGWDHGPNGEPLNPRKIQSVKTGKIALLTTIPKPLEYDKVIPNALDRILVGAFEIVKIKEDPGQETFIYGDSTTLLDDMTVYNIHFWDHHSNPRNPASKQWSTGLFRYVSDIAVLGILEEYINKKIMNHEDPGKA